MKCILKLIRIYSEFLINLVGFLSIPCKMSAFILVYDHPFFTTVNPRDSTASSPFKIENIPGGTYTLVSVREVERKGILQRKEQEVTIAAGKTTTVNVRF